MPASRSVAKLRIRCLLLAQHPAHLCDDPWHQGRSKLQEKGEETIHERINKVILVGRLGKDPDVRYTGERTAVANFRIATEENFTDRAGDKQSRMEWHRI